MLADEINSENDLAKTITLKYFDTGHTLMSVNNFHLKVESKGRQLKNSKILLKLLISVANLYL